MAFPDYVKCLGTGYAPSSSPSALISITESHGIANQLLLAIGITTQTRTVQSIVDSAGNVWSLLRQPSTLGCRHFTFVSDGSSQLASGDTLLINFNAATNSVAALFEIDRMSIVEEASGSWATTTQTPSGFLTTVSSGTITFATFADTSVVGSGTAIESSGFVTALQYHHPSQALHLHVAYREADVPEPLTYVATLDASKAMAINLSAFPNNLILTGPASSSGRRSTLPLLGAG